MVSDPGRAEAALTSLRELVRHVGHDLNNHLASIIVNLSLATASSGAEADRLMHAREALDAARSAAQLARELFAASYARGTDGLASDIAATREAGADDAHAAADSVDGSSPTAAHELAPAGRDDDRAGRADRATANADADADAGQAHGSLLVLEDDESVATMMQDVLTHFGYDVAVTQSPEACITIYDEARTSGQPFDLVVLDLTIRGGTRRGMDTLAALRLLDPAVRAVAHSGDPEAEIMKDPQRFGFAGAIRKPTPLAQLSRLIERLMSRDS